MKRRALKLICAGLVGVLLFAQLAAAAYACLGLVSDSGITLRTASWLQKQNGTSRQLATSPAANHVIDCDDMTLQSALKASDICVEHRQYGDESDQAPAVVVPAMLLNELYPVPLLKGAPIPRRAVPHTTWAIATGPPHAILHCCFRI